MVYPLKAVTHPSTNRAWRATTNATNDITVTPSRHPITALGKTFVATRPQTYIYARTGRVIIIDEFFVMTACSKGWTAVSRVPRDILQSPQLTATTNDIWFHALTYSFVATVEYPMADEMALGSHQ